MISLKYTTAMAESSEGVMSAVCDYLAAKLGVRMTAVYDVSWRERLERVADGRIDIGWICGSYYAGLANRDSPPVALLAAPVLAQARYGGKPVYFSDVVVRKESAFHSLEDLRGASFAYNESGSMSGYWAMGNRLAEMGADGDFFGRMVCSGAHVASLRMVVEGEVDTAAIDSMVMTAELQTMPETASEIRIVTALGPTPVPPWVAAQPVAGRGLPGAVRAQLQQALLSLHKDEAGRRVLGECHLRGFSAVRDGDYDRVREMMVNAAEIGW